MSPSINNHRRLPRRKTLQLWERRRHLPNRALKEFIAQMLENKAINCKWIKSTLRLEDKSLSFQIVTTKRQNLAEVLFLSIVTLIKIELNIKHRNEMVHWQVSKRASGTRFLTSAMLIHIQATLRPLLVKVNSQQPWTSTRLVLRSQAPYMIVLMRKMKKMIKALSLVGGAC